MDQARRQQIEMQFRETARKEVESRTMSAKVWVLALQEANDDEKAALELYPKLRVENLRRDYRKLAKEAVRMEAEKKEREEEGKRYDEQLAQARREKRRVAVKQQGESDLTYIAIMAIVVACVVAVVRMIVGPE